MLKVITVDDSSIIIDRIKSILNEINDVEFLCNACNISDALHFISKHKPDVVILDIHLKKDRPEENGINLAIVLKKNISKIENYYAN